MKTMQTHTLKALRELAMIFLVMIERDKKVSKCNSNLHRSKSENLC